VGIQVNLDMMMVRRHVKLKDLAEKIGITMANLSILKQNKAKAMRFSTLDALCRELKCQPGDLLVFVEGETGNTSAGLEETEEIEM
jgi:putative transcriptional regulator